MTAVRLIVWPFHDGLRDVGMGAGSSALAADEQLLAGIGGRDPRRAVDVVAPVDERRPEIARVVELDRRLAAAVRAVVDDGAFPLVLAGNCASCLGTVAGLRRDSPLGVVWLDAHADFDTPEDNVSGFFDVMALATLTGGAWRALRATIPGFAPVDEGDVVLAAVRDLEPHQRERLQRSAVRAVPGAFSTAQIGAALDDLRRRVGRVYLHVDLDALDAGEARAKEYAASGGPSAGDLLEAIDAVFDRFEVAAAALTAYDPAFDLDGRARDAARALALRIASRVRQVSGRP